MTATQPKNNMYSIWIQGAEGIRDMDSGDPDNYSDPFVEIQLGNIPDDDAANNPDGKAGPGPSSSSRNGGRVVFRSETIWHNLNPRWKFIQGQEGAAAAGSGEGSGGGGCIIQLPSGPEDLGNILDITGNSFESDDHHENDKKRIRFIEFEVFDEDTSRNEPMGFVAIEIARILADDTAVIGSHVYNIRPRARDRKPWEDAIVSFGTLRISIVRQGQTHEDPYDMMLDVGAAKADTADTNTKTTTKNNDKADSSTKSTSTTTTTTASASGITTANTTDQKETHSQSSNKEGKGKNQDHSLVQRALALRHHPNAEEGGGWTLTQDTSSKKWYYSNKLLGKTTWDLLRDLMGGKFPMPTGGDGGGDVDGDGDGDSGGAPSPQQPSAYGGGDGNDDTADNTADTSVDAGAAMAPAAAGSGSGLVMSPEKTGSSVSSSSSVPVQLPLRRSVNDWKLHVVDRLNYLGGSRGGLCGSQHDNNSVDDSNATTTTTKTTVSYELSGANSSGIRRFVRKTTKKEEEEQPPGATGTRTPDEETLKHITQLNTSIPKDTSVQTEEQKQQVNQEETTVERNRDAIESKNSVGAKEGQEAAEQKQQSKGNEEKETQTFEFHKEEALKRLSAVEGGRRHNNHRQNQNSGAANSITGIDIMTDSSSTSSPGGAAVSPSYWEDTVDAIVAPSTLSMPSAEIHENTIHGGSNKKNTIQNFLRVHRKDLDGTPVAVLDAARENSAKLQAMVAEELLVKQQQSLLQHQHQRQHNKPMGSSLMSTATAASAGVDAEHDVTPGRLAMASCFGENINDASFHQTQNGSGSSPASFLSSQQRHSHQSSLSHTTPPGSAPSSTQNQNRNMTSPSSKPSSLTPGALTGFSGLRLYPQQLAPQPAYSSSSGSNSTSSHSSPSASTGDAVRDARRLDTVKQWAVNRRSFLEDQSRFSA